MKHHISTLVRAPAEEGASGAGGTVAAAKRAVGQTAHDAAAKIKHTAAETASRTKEEAQRIAQQKKEDAANRVGTYGSALHRSAEALEDQDPNIAWFTHRAADRIEGVADYLRSRDFAALRRDAEGVARRHPAAFFGGMFLAGLVLGNVLTASQRKSRPNESADDSPPSDWPDESGRTIETRTDFPGAAAAGI